jgi:glycosyltransferase involved in cell wall biosynthesis
MSSDQVNFVSVVVPVYNESGCLGELISRVLTTMRQTGKKFEFILIDDGSSDGCADAIPTTEDLSLSHGSIIKVRRDDNRGKGAAVREAMLLSTGDVVMYTDCDLAYGTAVIHEAFETIKHETTDMLAGSRAIHPNGYGEYTALRRIASKVYIKLISVITGLSVTDSQCGFKAFKGETARKVFSYATINGWAFDFEILMTAQKLGYKIKEFPVKIINHRESKIHLAGDSIRMLRDLMKIKKHVKKNVK